MPGAKLARGAENLGRCLRRRSSTRVLPRMPPRRGAIQDGRRLVAQQSAPDAHRGRSMEDRKMLFTKMTMTRAFIAGAKASSRPSAECRLCEQLSEK